MTWQEHLKKYEWVLAILALVVVLVNFVSFFTSVGTGQAPNVLLFLAGFISLGYLVLRWAFPYFTFGSGFRTKRVARDQSIEEVRRSGLQLGSITTWGRIGQTNATRPLFSAEIYPGGLIVSTVLVGSIALRSEDITRVVYQHKFMRCGVEITHTSKDTYGPVFIGDVEENSDFGRALDDLAGPEKVCRSN